MVKVASCVRVLRESGVVDVNVLGELDVTLAVEVLLAAHVRHGAVCHAQDALRCLGFGALDDGDSDSTPRTTSTAMTTDS